MNTDDRRKSIVEAALDLIAELGIQELTMKKISVAIGVTEPALYRHFASKSEILAAVVDEMDEAWHAAISGTGRKGGNPAVTVADFFLQHARTFAARPAMTAILFSEDLFKNDDELFSRVVRLMGDTQKAIVSEITQGIEAGAFRKGLDAGTMALLLVGGFRLLVTNWRMDACSFDLVERTARFTDSAIKLMAG